MTLIGGPAARALIALAVLVSAAATHAADYERTLPAERTGEIEVRNLSGSVQVRGWDRAEVAIAARLADGQDIDVQSRSGRIVIEVSQPGQRRAREADLELRVPRDSRLRVSGVSADIEVDDVAGDLNLKSVSGHVDARGFGADLDVSTVNGRIRAVGSGQTGRLIASTVNGAIHVEGAAGQLEVSTVNGEVAITGGRFERVRLNGVNAHIHGHLELTEEGRFEADSVSGRLALRLPPELPARFDLESFSGRIQPCDGVSAERSSRFGPGYRLAFTRGAGTAQVQARSMSGEIALCEPAARAPASGEEPRQCKLWWTRPSPQR
ncbi:MAG: DUF4097 family beta strand repeat protein [Gammaproteobacteria bacterium]|nr:DUF4097 family beta strand repeat protein [Gammaproteobacteria bacterium]